MTKQDELTLNEVCELLGKSQRTIIRNIKKGLLNPEKVKSQKGMILLN
jgi:predicted DNA-binding transcriptional regulator AlpA